MKNSRSSRIFKFLGVSAMSLLLVPAVALSAGETDRSPMSTEESVEIDEGNASLQQHEYQESTVEEQRSRDPQSVPDSESSTDPMIQDQTVQSETQAPVPVESQSQPQAQAVTIRLNQTEVRQIQERLKDLGHYDAQIDGLWGPKTASAVEEFQQSQGLDTTGAINLRTLSALNVFGAGERAPASVPSETGTQDQQQSPQPRGENDRAMDSGLDQPEVDVQDTESY